MKHHKYENTSEIKLRNARLKKGGKGVRKREGWIKKALAHKRAAKERERKKTPSAPQEDRDIFLDTNYSSLYRTPYYPGEDLPRPISPPPALEHKVYLLHSPDFKKLVVVYAQENETAIETTVRSFGFGKGGSGSLSNLGYKVPSCVYGAKYHSLDGSFRGPDQYNEFSLVHLKKELQKSNLKLTAEIVSVSLDGTIRGMDDKNREEISIKINAYLEREKNPG